MLRPFLPEAQTGGLGALTGQFKAYDARTGWPISFFETVLRARRADVVLFGENHNDAVCNQIEAQMFAALASGPDPTALAMEFFERDTQSALDAYLKGRIKELTFRERTRQKRTYVLSHRPLIEIAKRTHAPVLAANAPRRLVTSYRESELPFPDFVAGLSDQDRQWLPSSSEPVEGPYRDRFFSMMSGHGDAIEADEDNAESIGQEKQGENSDSDEDDEGDKEPKKPGTNTEDFFRAQLLWDDSMAETLAGFRDRYPRQRVMLIVGGFHVQRNGGTRSKFQSRRPDDRVFTIVYQSSEDPSLAFDKEDRGIGDVVIYGIAPPPPKTADPEQSEPAAESR